VGVLVKVCEAMAYAHDKGVVHRDLKPSNVMVGRFGEVYVTDWGLARVLGPARREESRSEPSGTDTVTHIDVDRERRREDSSESPLYTIDGEVVGTPAYMCPEQAAGRLEEIGREWDVYALGAILYHLLAGAAPYAGEGPGPSAGRVVARVLAGPPRDPLSIAPGMPSELGAVCLKAMSRDPASSYASAQELGEDLRSWLEGRVVRAHATGTWAEARKWVVRNRGWVAAILLALTVTVSGLTASSLVLAAKNRALERAQLDSDDLLRIGLEEEAKTLGPAVPGNLEAYEGWRARARCIRGSRAIARSSPPRRTATRGRGSRRSSPAWRLSSESEEPSSAWRRWS
jgi:hypothetical protein